MFEFHFRNRHTDERKVANGENCNAALFALGIKNTEVWDWIVEDTFYIDERDGQVYGRSLYAE